MPSARDGAGLGQDIPGSDNPPFAPRQTYNWRYTQDRCTRALISTSNIVNKVLRKASFNSQLLLRCPVLIPTTDASLPGREIRARVKRDAARDTVFSDNLLPKFDVHVRT